MLNKEVYLSHYNVLCALFATWLSLLVFYSSVTIIAYNSKDIYFNRLTFLPYYMMILMMFLQVILQTVLIHNGK